MSCEALALRNHFSLAVRLRVPPEGAESGIVPPRRAPALGGSILAPRAAPFPRYARALQPGLSAGWCVNYGKDLITLLINNNGY